MDSVTFMRLNHPGLHRGVEQQGPRREPHEARLAAESAKGEHEYRHDDPDRADEVVGARPAMVQVMGCAVDGPWREQLAGAG
ncbi:hypothetical protein Mth01_03710 [Sphaerimonospora thailandensis]|uniref:Uncharacterized protein n=1 Tax=Sphaerimonospora thailandensis TaxID=795644 RepID=A0A8J3VXN6_9ACTN|nr:hypothetical protein Mth01_03710 [Sphaerimonospora thailandensis]